MPTFEFTSPEGKTFQLTGPEGSTPEQAFSHFQAAQPELFAGSKPAEAPALEPNAAFNASVRAGAERAAAPDTSLLQNVKVAAGAGLPYPTAAALGAMGGMAIGGPAGAAIGGAGAPLAMGAADLGVAGYNALAPMWGGNRMTPPSQTIQGLYEKAGIGAQPQTANQALLASIAGGASSAGTMGGAFKAAAPLAQSPVTRGVLGALGENPVGQAVSGATGSAAPTALQQYGGVDNPVALAAASLVGSIGGGLGAQQAARIPGLPAKWAANAATPTGEGIKAAAQNSYDKASEAGVVFRPEAFNEMTDSLRRNLGFDFNNPKVQQLYPKAAMALDSLASATETGLPGTSKPQTWQDMDTLRTIAKAAKTSADPTERMLGVKIGNAIDNFVLRPPEGAIFEGDAKGAAAATTDARSNWAKMSKNSEIEDLINRAAVSSKAAEGGKMDEALRAQFATLSNEITKGYHPNFTDAEVEGIRNIAEGKSGNAVLNALSHLKPSGNAGVMGTIGATGVTALANPMAALGIAAGVATGAGARAGRNALATSNANNLAAAMRRGDVTPPFSVDYSQLASPSVNALANTFNQ